MQDWTATVHGEHSEQEVLRVERLLELNHVEYTHIEEKIPDTVRVRAHAFRWWTDSHCQRVRPG